jgi:DegV family protein with EDD domain
MHMSKNRVIVVTDTTACLPNELTTQLEVEVVPVVFVFGKESFRDGIDMTNAQFYEKLRLADRLPTTSGGLTAPYLEAFTRAAKKGDSVLCLNLSSKLSAMTNSARMARELAASTLPCLRIEVLDTGTAAGAQGLIYLRRLKL